jgi:hypothetical protein
MYNGPTPWQRATEGDHEAEWELTIGNEPDVPVSIMFTFTPEEKTVLYPADDAYPGAPAYVDVFEVIRSDTGEDITDAVLRCPDLLAECEDAAWEAL